MSLNIHYFIKQQNGFSLGTWTLPVRSTVQFVACTVRYVALCTCMQNTQNYCTKYLVLKQVSCITNSLYGILRRSITNYKRYECFSILLRHNVISVLTTYSCSLYAFLDSGRDTTYRTSSFYVTNTAPTSAHLGVQVPTTKTGREER